MRRVAIKYLGLGCLIAISALLMGQGCPSPNTGGNNGGNNGGTTTPPAEKTFLGAAVCQECHSRHVSNWQQTAHAGAFDTLKAIHQDTNPECVSCHVVGFGETGGFVDEATTPELAGVQCESCHGPAAAHKANVDDRNSRPIRSIASDVCGKCHTDAHHPTFDEWKSSGHGAVTEHVALYFSQGTNLNSCGTCHSGDFRDLKFVQGQTSIPDTTLQGKTEAQMNAITCVICHDPHQKTGNSAGADPGEDFQLRFPEATSPDPANTIAATTDATRFNLCGQCHHTREATWQSTSRGPHHSLQANMYVGEMPTPDGVPLLPNQRSVHRFVPKQCATCHMGTSEFESEEVPADSGHSFVLKTSGCSAVGCHASEDSAKADLAKLQTEVQSRLDAIAARLGPLTTWGYASEGGPATQTGISDEVKKIRFEYFYITNDLSKGVHNPQYTRAILTDAETRLTKLGK